MRVLVDGHSGTGFPDDPHVDDMNHPDYAEAVNQGRSIIGSRASHKTAWYSQIELTSSARTVEGKHVWKRTGIAQNSIGSGDKPIDPAP